MAVPPRRVSFWLARHVDRPPQRLGRLGRQSFGSGASCPLPRGEAPIRRKRKANSRFQASQSRAENLRLPLSHGLVRTARQRADTTARQAPQRPVFSCRVAAPPPPVASG